MTPTPNGQEISHDCDRSRPLYESTPLGALACPTSPEPFFLWEQFKRPFVGADGPAFRGTYRWVKRTYGSACDP